MLSLDTGPGCAGGLDASQLAVSEGKVESCKRSTCASPVHYSAYLVPDAQKFDQGVPCYPKMLETSSGADWPSVGFLSEWVWAPGPSAMHPNSHSQSLNLSEKRCRAHLQILAAAEAWVVLTHSVLPMRVLLQRLVRWVHKHERTLNQAMGDADAF